MTDWISIVVPTTIQLGIGLMMLARMSATLEEKLSNLKEDTKDLQRDKLDKALYDAHSERLAATVAHVADTTRTRFETVEHKVRGVEQKVIGLEQRR